MTLIMGGMMSGNQKPPAGDEEAESADETRIFLLTLAGALLVLAAGYGLAMGFGVRIADQFDWRAPSFAVAVIAGLFAVAPLALMLHFFMRTNISALADFRASQVDFLANIGFRLTPARIVAIGLAAGVSEEILFRGALQSIGARHLPLVLAVFLPNILFGLLHARTMLYALIAGVIGCYLGALFAFTGNLLTPILTHAVYDMIALEIARREIARREIARREITQKEAAPGGG